MSCIPISVLLCPRELLFLQAVVQWAETFPFLFVLRHSVNVFQSLVLTHNNAPEMNARKINRPSLLSTSIYPSLKTVNKELKFKVNTEKNPKYNPTTVFFTC